MTYEGGCHCGAIRYRLEGEPAHVALCHCSDCRKSAGAPVVSWAMFGEGALTVTKGEPRTRNSSGAAMRSFCPECGSGLFYRNAEVLPGMVDVQSATLDAPEKLPPGAQIQTADRIAWMERAHELPSFERYPQG